LKFSLPNTKEQALAAFSINRCPPPQVRLPYFPNSFDLGFLCPFSAKPPKFRGLVVSAFQSMFAVGLLVIAFCHHVITCLRFPPFDRPTCLLAIKKYSPFPLENACFSTSADAISTSFTSLFLLIWTGQLPFRHPCVSYADTRSLIDFSVPSWAGSFTLPI